MSQIKSKPERQISFIKNCGDPEHQVNHGDELGRLWGNDQGGGSEIHQNLNEYRAKFPSVILPCNVGKHAKHKRNRQ